jgi:hypothetical protein
LGSISNRELTYEVHVDENYTDFGVQVRLNVCGIKNDGSEVKQRATALETILGRLRGVGADHGRPAKRPAEPSAPGKAGSAEGP